MSWNIGSTAPSLTSAGESQNDFLPKHPAALSEEEVWQKYVQKRADRYLEAFRKIREGQTAPNIAIFFIGPFWLAYRKLYFEAFCWFVIVIGVDFVLPRFIDSPSAIDSISKGIASLVNGLLMIYANNLYLNKIKKLDVMGAMLRQGDPERWEIYARKKGGTSVLAVFLTIFFLFAALLFLPA